MSIADEVSPNTIDTPGFILYKDEYIQDNTEQAQKGNDAILNEWHSLTEENRNAYEERAKVKNSKPEPTSQSQVNKVENIWKQEGGAQKQPQQVIQQGNRGLHTKMASKMVLQKSRKYKPRYSPESSQETQARSKPNKEQNHAGSNQQKSNEVQSNQARNDRNDSRTLIVKETLQEYIRHIQNSMNKK